MEKGEERRFEIALVGAGAISAGAYSAGVMDFIVQALDEWEAAKRGGAGDIPNHGVVLSAFSGASAGSMVATLATGFMGTRQPHVASAADPEEKKVGNRLFKSWVRSNRIERLLECRDLAAGKPAASLLDSTVLDEIAKDGLHIDTGENVRPYLKDPFQLILTVTNLAGVPYGFVLRGDGTPRYEMTLHADHVRFEFTRKGIGSSDCLTIPWSEFANPRSRLIAKLGQAALASGAFPVGLAPRNLEARRKSTTVHPGEVDPHQDRLWPVPTPASKDPHRCVTDRFIPPSWGEEIAEDEAYAYSCVDGGIMNNEPIELARRVLSPDGNLPGSGLDVDKAILLIDPFPAKSRLTPPRRRTFLLETLQRILFAVVFQTRFKPTELALAADENHFSSFLIAPTRPPAHAGAPTDTAGGCLGGFGGFLKEEFRQHDYFLGRRNAQRFLQEHFALPQESHLFDGWGGEAKKDFIIPARDKDGRPIPGEPGFRPIIPLVGEAKKECPLPEWPTLSPDDLLDLLPLLKERISSVGSRLVDESIAKEWFPIRWILRIALFLSRGLLARIILIQVDRPLKRYFRPL